MGALSTELGKLPELDSKLDMRQLNPFNSNLGSYQTLLRVEVSGRLVDEVDVGGLAQRKGDGHTLQLTTRERSHLEEIRQSVCKHALLRSCHQRAHASSKHELRFYIAVQTERLAKPQSPIDVGFLRTTYQLVHDVVDLEGLQDVADELRMDVRSLNLSVEQLPHRTLDRQSGMQSSYNSSKKHQSISSQATCHVRKEMQTCHVTDLEFRRDFLRLVRDVELWHAVL